MKTTITIYHKACYLICKGHYKHLGNREDLFEQLLSKIYSLDKEHISDFLWLKTFRRFYFDFIHENKLALDIIEEVENSSNLIDWKFLGIKWALKIQHEVLFYDIRDEDKAKITDILVN